MVFKGLVKATGLEPATVWIRGQLLYQLELRFDIYRYYYSALKNAIATAAPARAIPTCSNAVGQSINSEPHAEHLEDSQSVHP